MSFAGMFGIGVKKIIEGGCRTLGIITEQKTLYWIKINTKPVRMGPMDGAIFPGFIRFTYTVEGIEYRGSRLVSPYVRCPEKGMKITVFYDANNPSKYAVNI